MCVCTWLLVFEKGWYTCVNVTMAHGTHCVLTVPISLAEEPVTDRTGSTTHKELTNPACIGTRYMKSDMHKKKIKTLLWVSACCFVYIFFSLLFFFFFDTIIQSVHIKFVFMRMSGVCIHVHMLKNSVIFFKHNKQTKTNTAPQPPTPPPPHTHTHIRFPKDSCQC